MLIVSLVWGILALVVILTGFVTFFGALSWLLVPVAVFAAIVSAIWTWHSA